MISRISHEDLFQQLKKVFEGLAMEADKVYPRYDNVVHAVFERRCLTPLRSELLIRREGHVVSIPAVLTLMGDERDVSVGVEMKFVVTSDNRRHFFLVGDAAVAVRNVADALKKVLSITT